MIAFCLICEGAIKFVGTPMGIEARCSECYGPADDSASDSVEALRGLGKDQKSALDDLTRTQNEYLEDNAHRLFDELEQQVTLESARQTFDNVCYVIGPFDVRCPRKALELAKWAAQGKAVER